MAMYNPPHPGEVIREEILKPLGLSVTEAAQHLGVSRKILSEVLEQRAAVTPEMAYRLSLLFKPSDESWLRQQAAYDLWQVRQHSADIHITPFEAYAV
ncbi:MAG: addiction module antidote protein, HigA family [Candidatus Parabeggiatoa sp. nov. 1]|nr:MAG: addiction module antidote protein, HigA family [Gammaproteobacteria bacterium]